MALGHEWCCNDYGVISYIIRISLAIKKTQLYCVMKRKEKYDNRNIR